MPRVTCSGDGVADGFPLRSGLVGLVDGTEMVHLRVQPKVVSGMSVERARKTLIAFALGMLVWQPTQAATDDTGPQLPGAPSFTGAVKRGPSGEIELFDPTKEKGTAPSACAANAICVGPGQAYTSLASAAQAARDGDVIEILGGTYHETATIGRDHVTVRGIKGRPKIDCTGIRPSADKACVLLNGNFITLENLEISGAQIDDGLGANAACIRNGPNMSFTLRGVICHGSQDGILSDGGTIVVENSEFYDNGWNGQTHNVYFSGNCNSVTVRNSTFRDARVGHEFKSRCAETTIIGSTIRSTHGSRNLDIPDGGATLIENTTLVKEMGAESWEIVGFAAEHCTHPADMVLKNVHIINQRPKAAIHNFDKCDGHPIVLENVTVEGTPIEETGNVVKR
jgi:hypothetical protein